MRSCVFFGHRQMQYEKYRAQIEKCIVDLIENHGVTQFYSGGRGDFDRICSVIVGGFKRKYPYIRNTLVLSYIPLEKENFYLPPQYDDSIYLLEGYIPPRLAILKTNERMALRADYVVSGVRSEWGGAWTAMEYAKKHKKQIVSIFSK